MIGERPPPASADARNGTIEKGRPDTAGRTCLGCLNHAQLKDVLDCQRLASAHSEKEVSGG